MKPQNAALLNRWVQVLRSGTYKQARGGLKVDDAYCCLGVLCDLVDPSRWKGERYAGESFLPPKDIIPYHIARELSTMNDGVWKDGLVVVKQHSFHEIAEFIEAAPDPWVLAEEKA